jgi:hypothetical protein
MMHVPTLSPPLRRGLIFFGLWLLMMTLIGAAQASPAAAFPATMTVGNERLALNGHGTRWKLLLPVYEAGLYTARPVHTADDLFALRGAKRLHAVALRDIDAESLGRLFIRGVADNNPHDQALAAMPAIAQVSALFTNQRKIKRGDSFGFDDLPGQGTRLMINGVPQGEAIKDAAFFPVVMRMWLGPAPVDTGLKAALLGNAPATQTAAREP